MASFAGRHSKIRVEIVLSSFWGSNFKGIFYLSSILFGLLHIKNYNYSINVVLLTPILISPQIIAGLFLGYLRIKYNLALGYFMHALHNAIFFNLIRVFIKVALIVKPSYLYQRSSLILSNNSHRLCNLLQFFLKNKAARLMLLGWL
ncbi:MAG: CPBP family intramembrane metalloprotease [Pyrinomonadaceae bacterium]|nr:CPBP family intramembrane metalloprotease [Sphingobacteriaceae bacterium]